MFRNKGACKTLLHMLRELGCGEEVCCIFSAEADTRDSYFYQPKRVP